MTLPVFRRALPDNGYTELPSTSRHGCATARLPLSHKCPFNRPLVAKDESKDALLRTGDRIVARHNPGPVRRVRCDS